MSLYLKIWRNLTPIHLRLLSAKCIWNWSNSSSWRSSFEMSFIWKIMNSLNPRELGHIWAWVIFGWNWFSDSGEEEFRMPTLWPYFAISTPSVPLILFPAMFHCRDCMVMIGWNKFWICLQLIESVAYFIIFKKFEFRGNVLAFICVWNFY